jgi:hypothetical protein
MNTIRPWQGNWTISLPSLQNYDLLLKLKSVSGKWGLAESAGINRHGVADERAVLGRSSDPLRPRVMRRER